MPDKLDYQLIDQIANADSLSGLTRLLQGVATRLGASGFFGSIRCSRPVVEPVFWAFSSDPDWNEAYRENSQFSFNPLWEQVDEGLVMFSWEAPEVIVIPEPEPEPEPEPDANPEPTPDVGDAQAESGHAAAASDMPEGAEPSAETDADADPDAQLAAQEPEVELPPPPPEFWTICELAGFQQGVTICVHQEPKWTFALSFAALHDVKIDLSEPADLQVRLNLITLAALHCLIRHVMPGVVNQALPKISAREISCLKWAARGRTASEISTLIGVSEATVVFHLNNLMKKLRVNNRTQAIAVGISMGLTS